MDKALLRTAVFLLCIIFGFVHPDDLQASEKNSRPNFIHIMADDLGWGDLACYGNQFILSPNLDKLASQGMRYTQAYVNAPVCSPARAGIMTGNFPARHRIHAWYNTLEVNRQHGMPQFLDTMAINLPRLMKQNGYTTGHFGKWHLCSGRDPDVPTPSSYGIDQWKVFIAAENTPSDQDPSWSWNVPDFNTFSSKAIINEAINFLDDNSDNPFYMNIWLYDVHRILNPTDEMMKPYEKYGMTTHGLKGKYHGIRKVYYAHVSEMDKQIGRLMDYLDEKGLADNTVIVFTSDNGPENNMVSDASYSYPSHTGAFRGLKSSIYEGGIRVPFIARWPGHIPKNSINRSTIVSGTDWLPTVCNIAGIDLPDGYDTDGEVITASLKGKDQVRKKLLFWEWRFDLPAGTYILHISPMLAVRDGKWKLLMNRDGSRIELYDLEKSVMEVDNLADQYPEVAERLSKELLDWHHSMPDGPIFEIAGDNTYPFN